MPQTELRVDLHVHSKYSKRPSEWVLRKIGTAESYTEPLSLYNIARERGMDYVTITDHNTLDGSLEIAHLDNTFISEEITTYFPEDGCKLHVLAYRISESNHADITRLRENVFDLVAYLNREKIIHVIAHPLYSVNDRLTIEHFEQLLLLFNNFELNGTRDAYQNQTLTKIIKNLTPEQIMKLADRHNLAPIGETPWIKNLTSGSDDHSSVNIASAYTIVKNARNLDDFFGGVVNNKAETGGRSSHPRTLAHSIYSIAYQFYKNKFGLEKYANEDLLLKFLDHALVPIPNNDDNIVKRIRSYFINKKSFLKSTNSSRVQDLVKDEARKLILGNPSFSAHLKKKRPEPMEMAEVWFDFVDMVSDKILKHFADTTLESLHGANVFNLFNTIGSMGSLYTMLAPYFVTYAIFTKDRNFTKKCQDEFIRENVNKNKLSVGHFTDTFYDVNGVAKTLQMQVQMAKKNGKSLNIIICGPESDLPEYKEFNNSADVKAFTPVGTFSLPEYPEIKLYYPPFLQMLKYCYDMNFTHIHAATPGPVGLTALALAHILKLPIYGTYHTAFPQYVNQLTGDNAMEELTWRFIIWFYNQMDVVYVPSHATGNELVEKGIHSDKIRYYPRGIDIERFHPVKRNGFFKKHFNMNETELKLLYTGRVSKEKNLPVLVSAFKQINKKRPGIRLVVVGEGPYLKEMKKELKNLPVTYTGYLRGEELAHAYASSDIFIFPSTTDTFGNVVLEAQSSGLPVVISDEGGPKENIIPDETGFMVSANETEAYADAVIKLADDPKLLRRMSVNARNYMKNRSFEQAFLKQWESYRKPFIVN